MNDRLQKKLREGIDSRRSFVLPESFGSHRQATDEEVYQLLKASWIEFCDLNFSELREFERYLEQQEKDYQSRIDIEDEIIRAVHEKRTEKETGRIYIELNGRIGRQRVIVGDKMVSHKKEADGTWTTRWSFFQPHKELQEAAYALRKKLFNTSSVIRFRLSVLREVLWQKAAFGQVPKWKDYWVSLPSEEKERLSRRGRRLATDSDPEEVLKVLDALCDFTGDPENKSLPFFSRAGRASMCSHLADCVNLSQEGARSKIQEVLRQLESKYEMGMPRFRTNKHLYFEKRNLIVKARDRFRTDYQNPRTEN